MMEALFSKGTILGYCCLQAPSVKIVKWKIKL
jgi:hypothetical protein